ncbi:DNA-binding MarR family transcriptional regulator [Acetoanaerobium pronyense]|uniref:HTH-type transcriptional regulator SarZ n=1 Tax=Acetoanaerobium pronyense TaxID=1482736 RepID=A0ABS4KEM1_9FIRM|nr:DNA-binding MarR family transcriptional regulator [Acetoanaerobium pronyense]
MPKFIQKCLPVTRGITDLSMNEMHTIEAIGYEDIKSMTETAEILRITVGTLTTSVNRLVKKGYVERLRDDTDRRIVLIKLTEKGKEVFKIHEQFHIEMVEKLLEDLNLEEDTALIGSLEKLKHFFDEKYSE